MKFNFNWSAVSGGAPYITLSSLGIAFNSVSISILGSPEKIIIGFDEMNRVIGIKAFNEEHGMKPYEFAGRIKNGWVRVGCKDFIKYLQSLSGQDFSNAQRYIARYDSEEKILFIDVMGNTTRDIEEETE